MEGSSRRVHLKVLGQQCYEPDYHFAMLNQLHPIWKGKPCIEEAITRHKQRNASTHECHGQLKSMGFDHTRDTNRHRVQNHFAALEQQGLSFRIREQFDLLGGNQLLESGPRER